MPEVQTDADGLIIAQRCCEPDCREMKDVEKFSNDASRKTGLSPRCKTCQAKRVRQWRTASKDAAENDGDATNRAQWLLTKPWKYWSNRTRTNHRSRGYDVSGLSRSDLEEKAEATEFCPICGVRLNWDFAARKRHDGDTPTLDRIHNDNVLTPENVWVVCHRCNGAKGAMSFAEFVRHCQTVGERFSGWLAEHEGPK